MAQIRTERRRSANTPFRESRAAAGVLGGERGIALVVALVMLVLLGIIGSMALNTSSTELRISGNFRLTQDAFFVAESALEYTFLNSDIYESIIPSDTSTKKTWPLKGAGSSTDKNFNRVEFDQPAWDGSLLRNPADVRVEWVTCDTLPDGFGGSVEACVGECQKQSGNYYLVNVRGHIWNQAETEIGIESLELRPAANCL